MVMNTTAEATRKPVGRAEDGDRVPGTVDRRVPVKVLIIDTSWHYADALSGHLSRRPGFEVCGVANTAADAIRLMSTRAAGVAVVDLELFRGALGDLIAAGPETRIVVVAQNDNAEIARRCIADRAVGYVVKRDRSDIARIMQAVRAAAVGDIYLDATLTKLIETAAKSPHGLAIAAGLTPREHDVLLLIAEGFDNKRIAERLGIGVQTTKNHSSAIRAKLHASSRIEAVIKARHAGLVG